MDLQEYVRHAFAGRRIILVGNARFRDDRAAFVDAYEVVVRFNLFEEEWFAQGLCGEKLDYWCVNLVTGRKSPDRRRRQDRHCRLVKALNPTINVMTPHEEDKHRRLRDAKEYYPQRGLQLVYPDSGLDTGLGKQPTTGFYLAFRLVFERIPFSAIGFTGVKSEHHDGEAEVAKLRNHDLIDFCETP